MAGWGDASFWDLPIGARPDQYSRDELGNPLMRGIGGQTYALDYQQQGRPEGGYIRGILGAIANKPGQVARGLLDAAVSGVTAPARAARGETVTYGDAFDAAGSAAIGGLLGAVPGGSLASNTFRNLDPDDFEYLGFRTVDKGYDPLLSSNHWDDGERTAEILDGVSVTDRNFSGAEAMHGLAPKDYRLGYYPGDETYLIGGNKASRGADDGELIISDPVVIEIMRRLGVSAAVAAGLAVHFQRDPTQQEMDELRAYVDGA